MCRYPPPSLPVLAEPRHCSARPRGPQTQAGAAAVTRPGSSAPEPPLGEERESPTGQAFRPGSAQALDLRSVGRGRDAVSLRVPVRVRKAPGAARTRCAPSSAGAGSCPRGGVEGCGRRKAERRERPERQRARLRAVRALGQGLPGPLGWRRGSSAVYEPVGGFSSSAADQGARDRSSSAPLPPVFLTPPPRRSLL